MFSLKICAIYIPEKWPICKQCQYKFIGRNEKNPSKFKKKCLLDECSSCKSHQNYWFYIYIEICHSLLILELLSLSSPTIRLQFSQQFTANERRTEEQFLSEFIFLWLWEKHMEPCSKYAVFFVCGRCHFKWSRTTEHLSLTKESCPICGTCTSAPHSVSTTFSKWFDFHICQPWL